LRGFILEDGKPYLKKPLSFWGKRLISLQGGSSGSVIFYKLSSQPLEALVAKFIFQELPSLSS